MDSPAPLQPGTVSVLMAAYNEAATIVRVITSVLELSCVLELIVVDDGSTDGTAGLIRSVKDSRVHLVEHATNRGKTAAIASALPLVRGDVVVIQDADLEYDPREIPHLVAPIFEGHADVVFGSRFLVRRAARVLYFYHYVANRALTTLSNLLTNLNMTDIETGYKAFRTEVVKNLPLTSTGFGLEVEITASIAALPLRIYEVPVSYYGRTYGEGKKVRFRDGVSAFLYVLYFNTLERRFAARRSYRAQVLKALRAR